MIGDLERPVNVSRGSVSISWASCFRYMHCWKKKFASGLQLHDVCPAQYTGTSMSFLSVL